MEQSAKIVEALATLFWAMGFLVFFGPIITILSIVGKFKLGLINLDWSKLSKFTRAVLGFIGLGMWLAIYIPLVTLAFRTVPQIQTVTAIPTLITTDNVTAQAQSPIITDTPIFVENQPEIIITPTFEGSNVDPTVVVITEVSGNPCGDDLRNEFIELYNTSEQPINVDGWWITDGDASDKIVSWASRFPTVKIGFMTQTETTIIPSHGFAVILAAGYPFVQTGFVMPYIFPEKTLILTTEKGELLGDETYGIEVSNRDIVVLYQGSETSIDKIISTYGSPILSSSPTAIKDDGKDKIPFDTSENECWSVERIIPINEDIELDWRTITTSSPGNGSYCNVKVSQHSAASQDNLRARGVRDLLVSGPCGEGGDAGRRIGPLLKGVLCECIVPVNDRTSSSIAKLSRSGGHCWNCWYPARNCVRFLRHLENSSSPIGT